MKSLIKSFARKALHDQRGQSAPLGGTGNGPTA